MTYINSNLTNREAYAQYGKLDDERMQELLDIEDEHGTLETERDEAQGECGNMRCLTTRVVDDLRAIKLEDKIIIAAIIKKAIDDLEYLLK